VELIKLNKKIYGACLKSSPGGPKVMQKAIENHNKWNIGFYKFCEKYSIPKLTFQWHLKDKVKSGLNIWKTLNGREVALGQKVKDELVKMYFIYRRMCVRSNDQWCEAPCNSYSWDKFQIAFIMFAVSAFRRGLRGLQPRLNKEPASPGQIFRIHLKRIKRS
jgi:hypothetical protein